MGNITAAPNPAQTELNMYTDGNEVANCNIYKLQGALCMKMKFEQNTEHQISVESLSPGLYILRWENGRENTLIKFIKN
ncbi:MAG: T9SS type A sorting domain-containing protein [Bacteroidia bacterium]|jgi:hypothetical protein|nr:T9SS type A sorting domain-containing protein [Bacteroidia bacterium]